MKITGQQNLVNKALSKLKENLETIKEQFGVKRIGVFGSVVRGEAKDESDIDILVEFDQEEETFDNLMNLFEFLEDLFQSKIDLVTKGSLSPYIDPYITQEIVYVEE